jgi:hypothetical protein
VGVLPNFGMERDKRFSNPPPRDVAVLVGKSEQSSPLRRPDWEDNIKMDLNEIGWEGMAWICLARNLYQSRILVNMAMSIRVL